MNGITIHQGDALEVLKTLPDESVNCVVTSPPYWGLRDYGCEGQLGLESSPYEYIDRMVDIFREVRRVLRSDGTLWMNMGDCYATGAGAVGECPGGGERGARWKGDVSRYRDARRRPHGQPGCNGAGDPQGYRGGRDLEANGKHKYVASAMGPMTQPNRMPIDGLKPKDLVGMPWRLAFALQADGWYLRADVIWAKPNPMPESVRDRPTKAHEYLFLLSKSERYYYDFERILEPVTGNAHARGDGVNPKCFNGSSFTSAQDQATKANLGRGPRRGYKMPDGWDSSSGNGGHGSVHRQGREKGRKQNPSFSAAVNDLVEARNKRSVWTVPTQAFSEAHFATFPEELIKPCILAGCPVGGTVMDPFFGSGTTGLVARANGCKCIGIELNPEYIKIAERRLAQEHLEFA